MRPQQPGAGGVDASLQNLDALSDEHLAQMLALLLQREVHVHLTQVGHVTLCAFSMRCLATAEHG